MYTTQIVRCPNCGCEAQRHFYSDFSLPHWQSPSNQITQVECHSCDYLMVTCSVTGKVIETYAPGIVSGKFSQVQPQILQTTISRQYWQSLSPKRSLTTSQGS